MTGKFIVIEGADGTGTTTQSKKLVEKLNASGHKTVWTCEPFKDGETEVLIRSMLSQSSLSAEDKTALAKLFAKNRRIHLETFVKPHLEAGYHVVTDRYYLSSLVYQGLDFDESWIDELNADRLEPGLQILLSVTPAISADRISNRSQSMEVFDKEEFRTKIHNRYISLADKGIVLDASFSIEEVAKRINKKVLLFIGVEIADGG